LTVYGGRSHKPRGVNLLADPILTKDLASDDGERDSVGLRGLLRPRVLSIGVRLSAILGQAREVTEEMYLVVAHTLANHATNERFTTSAVDSPVSALRDVSRDVPVRVVCQARDCGVGRLSR
jgi:hypothetical protein